MVVGVGVTVPKTMLLFYLKTCPKELEAGVIVSRGLFGLTVGLKDLKERQLIMAVTIRGYIFCNLAKTKLCIPFLVTMRSIVSPTTSRRSSWTAWASTFRQKADTLKAWHRSY